MRKLMLLILPISLGLGGKAPQPALIEPLEPTKIEVKVVEPTFVKPTYTLDVDPLIQAMIMVESEGNDSAYHKGEKAAGCLQIRPIMVREVNRILRKQGLDKRFKNSDRKSGDKSIEMFNIWADAYHLNSSYEKMARNWNGGPKGYKKSATSHYWKKVTNYVTLNL